MAGQVLTRRELNRATLARQLLLPGLRRPSSAAVPGLTAGQTRLLGALAQVAGLQAQASRAAYLGSWARVPGFAREDLTGLLQRRLAVKATLMRATIHLVTADDYLLFRAAVQPMLTRLAQGYVSRNAPGATIEELEQQTRPFLAEPRTLGELRAFLEDLFPAADTMRLAYAVRMQLALIHVPDQEAAWGFPAQPRFVDAEVWLGRPVPASAGPAALILRYLAAFGPATVQDIAAWSGLTGLRHELDRLRPELRTFRNEKGRELFDLPDAELPAGAELPPEEEVPPVFVPEWDSVLLAHADRSRIVADELQKPFFRAQVQLIGPAALLDGFVVARWRLEDRGKDGGLQVLPLVKLGASDREALAREGERLVRFARPSAATTQVGFSTA